MGKASTRRASRRLHPQHAARRSVRPPLSSRNKELLCLLGLFALALTLRLMYQSESITESPLRADAGRYYSAAWNLRYHGTYALDLQTFERPPVTRTDLPPGYPLFLSVFYPGEHDHEPEAFVRVVRRVQAVMGAFMVLVTFLLARRSLDRPWALTAGLFTAISPHLIALDDYILSESFFTFTVMLGTLALAVDWTRGRPGIALLGGILIAASAHIRTINTLFVFVVAPLFLISPSPSAKPARLVRVMCAGLVLVGFVCVWGAHRVFVDLTVINSASIQGSPNQSVRFESPSAYFARTIPPPRFMVEGDVTRRPTGPRWINHPDVDGLFGGPKTEASFWEAPVAYLKWNLAWKISAIWDFDNAYNGDVYMYPMTRKGFEENLLLLGIHRLMRLLHWPLFGLAAAMPFLLLSRWWQGRLTVGHRALLLSAVGLLYLTGAAWLVSWMPRYSVPARPFCYILATATLFSIYARVIQDREPRW